MQNEFYKKGVNDQVWWLDNGEEVTGEFVFSFDKKKMFNLFRDYPHELSVEEWRVFNKDNPFWVEFFKDRNEEYKKKNNIK